MHTSHTNRTPAFPRTALSAVLGMVMLAGCASAPTAPAPASADYLRYANVAGEPVSDFRVFGTITRWTPLHDRALVVWPRVNEAYLLDVAGPCPDLAFAQAIQLTESAGRVSARFDQVIPRSLAGADPVPPMPCRIMQIRPLDVNRLREIERAASPQGSPGT